MNFYANPNTRQCLVGGTCPATPVRLFADDVTNLCVERCPANYFSDAATGRCLVFCSVGFYAAGVEGTGRCVEDCPY